MGENAGVVDVGDGWAVTFKIESHNHPSYVEPYQGAATGVGGIVRDILTMGARPVAVMDSLRFGPADAPDTARVLPGVVAGVGGYGNCLGLPNIGGEVVLRRRATWATRWSTPCASACMRTDGIKLAKADGPGQQGRAVRRPDRRRRHRRRVGAGQRHLRRPKARPSGPRVQVGDPFAEKVLIECCLEIFAADLVAGIQDLGAAGLSCATTELAAAGTGGMDVDLDLVPLRDPTLAPEEILMSESQERMMAVVDAGAASTTFLAVCAQVGRHRHRHRHGHRHRPAADDAGTASRSSTCRRAPPRTTARSTSARSSARSTRTPSTSTTAHGLPRPRDGDELRATAAALIALAEPAPTSRGSPTSTTGTCWATPCWPSPRTPA